VHLYASQRVKGTERLIEKQQVGLAEQRSCQSNPLGLTSRESLGPVPLVAIETDLAERLEASLGCTRAGRPEDDVVKDPRPGEEPRILEHHRTPFGHVEVAAGAIVETGESAQDGALTGTAPTEQGNELARGNVEVDAPEHLSVAEGATQTAHYDGAVRRRVPVETRNCGGGGAHRPGCHRSVTRSIERTRVSVSRPKTA